MKLRKKIALGLVGALAGILVAAVADFYWASQPVVSNRSVADPAVTYLNSKQRLAGSLTEGYFEHEGNSLHYVEAGSGEAIIFLHGFPSYWFSFVRQIEALAGRYRVIAIDGLGAGRSDAPGNSSHYRLQAMSPHVIGLMNHLGVEQAHLVGHDWGAAFAFGLAQQHPVRFKSVTGLSAPTQAILLDALASNPEIQKKAGYIERLKRANPVLVFVTGGQQRIWTGAYEPLVKAGHLNAEEGQLFRQAASDPRRTNAHINWYRANIPTPDAIQDSSYWPARNARLSVPAQLIWGAQDQVFDASYASGMRAISDDIMLNEIPRVRHWPHIERADYVTKAIIERIERNRHR